MLKKEAYIYINYKNIVVLRNYLDIIKIALEEIGFKCEYIDSIIGISKKAIIVFPMGTDAFRFFIKGYRKIVLWQQGATAEESFLRHQSKLRYHILNSIDCFIMKKAKFIFFVSDNLRRYYEEKASCSFENKSYLMPCFNEEYDSSVFEKKNYNKKNFSYVGSLDLWQCFEQITVLFSKIEAVFPEASIKVLTNQTEDAKRILGELNIKNYCVKSVPKEQVKYELLDVNYGFIIRDDIEINRVSTPTKISSYLAAGVLPIYSICLQDFSRISRNKKTFCPVDRDVNFDRIKQYLETYKDSQQVEYEISEIFSTYYSKDFHIKRMVKLLDEIQ